MFRLAMIAAVFSTGLAQAEPIGDLRFIGGVELPPRLTVDGARVGGLSGLERDPASGHYLAISDDRSDFAPARFYEIDLHFANDRLSGADVLSATILRQADGSAFPSGKQADAEGHGEVPDPEAIRIDPRDGALWWTSEGDRARGLAPFLRRAGRDGRFIASIPMLPMFAIRPETGPRANLGFEGLSFASDGDTLWLAMESAMMQDGPTASAATASVARITHLSRDGVLLAQYAYPIDAIPLATVPGKFADNGVTEILALDERRLLVIERAAAQNAEGLFSNHIRLYEADIAEAEDIASMPSLAGTSYRPMTKRFVADLGALYGARIDNIEGITWGPRLTDGRRTLVFVSDDNFNPSQTTQILAFAIDP
jgi:hypothetical protein